MTKLFSKIWIIVIFAVVLAGGFFVWQYFGTQKAQTQKTDSVVLRWDSQTDKILSILNEKFPECFAQLNIAPEVRIFEEADITGDEIPEALIWNGCTGAYTTHMVLFQFIDGEPSLASFVDENGNKLETEIFLTGSSVMNFNKFGLLGDLQGIYGAIGSASADACTINWKTRAFRLDKKAFRLDNNLSQGLPMLFLPLYFDPKQGPVLDLVQDCPTGKPYIKVIFPNGGEKLIKGKTYDIIWESKGLGSPFITVAVIGSSDYFEIAKDISPSLGRYSWTVPDFKGEGGTYKIEILDLTSKDLRGFSDEYFSIISDPALPSIIVLSPNGGEEFKIGNTYDITWQAKGGIQEVDIVLINGWPGVPYPIIRRIPAAPGRYSWKVSNATNEQYWIGSSNTIHLIGFTSIADGDRGFEDRSDGAFSITE